MVFNPPYLLTTNMDNNTKTMSNKSDISGNNNNIPISTVDPDSNSGSPRCSTESSSAFGALLSEGTVVSHEDTNMDITEEEMDEEEEASDDNANTTAVEKKTQEKKETEPRHLIHAALVAGGVQLRPREAKALLRALDVSPNLFVRLGLVDRKAVHPMHEGKVYHGFPQQCGLGSPYRRDPPMGKSRRGPPHDPPRVTHFRRGHLHYGSWFDGGIGHSSPLPLSRGYPGSHKHFLNSKSRGMHGPRMLSPPCFRSCSPMYRGPGHHGSPHRRRDTGRRRHSVSPPNARGSLRSHQHPVILRSHGEEEHNVPIPSFGPCNLNDTHHYGRGYGRRTQRGRVLSPRSPSDHVVYSETICVERVRKS